MDRSVISFPEPSLVLLVGPSASGKSTFAKKHFKPTEVISSDYCRALVSDDENSNEATADAFEVLGFIAAKRLARGKTTVIDATNVQAPSRKKLLQLARQFHVHAVAIVLNLPRKVLEQRNIAIRGDRDVKISLFCRFGAARVDNHNATAVTLGCFEAWHKMRRG